MDKATRPGLSWTGTIYKVNVDSARMALDILSLAAFRTPFARRYAEHPKQRTSRWPRVNDDRKKAYHPLARVARPGQSVDPSPQEAQSGL